MLIRLRNSLGRFLCATFVTLLLIGLTIISSLKQMELSSKEQIQSPYNIANSVPTESQIAISRSRNSAVNVMSISEEGYVSSSSGTYIKFNDRYYIITVGHGIIGGCDSIRIVTEGGMHECVEMSLVDHQTDYAIMEVGPILDRDAIRIPRSYPRPNQWHQRLAIQSGTYYTGYPNGLGRLTFGGTIAGHDSYENVYVHSFAWPGSSGSGVFSDSGDLIGIVVAISVGATEFGVDVLEDIVIVVPLYKINWNML